MVELIRLSERSWYKCDCGVEILIVDELPPEAGNKVICPKCGIYIPSIPKYKLREKL